MWEPQLLQFLTYNASKDKSFVDVGSNFGWHSLLVSDYYKEVHCFEPQKILTEIQRSSFIINNINNFFIYNVALSDVEGEALLSPIYYEQEEVNTGDVSLWHEGTVTKVSKLDSYNIHDVGIIKIDVQGIEPKVIKGCNNIIDRDRPILVVEVENLQLKLFNYSAIDVCRELWNRNYYGFLIESPYPSDIVFVPNEKLNSFREKNKNYISNLTYSNQVNNCLEIGIKEKLNYFMIDDRYFTINESKFPYHIALEEKTIEIPLGIFFINNFGFGITEIGDNMGNYNYKCAEVLDINSLPDLTKRNILSISTINNIPTLQKILAEANNFLLTWKFTNSELDDYVFANSVPYIRMENINQSNKWIKNNLDGGLMVITNLKSLL